MDAALIRQFLGQTEVIKTPTRALATFGATHIVYHLISPVENLENKTRLREGTVLSHKPVILTPDSLVSRFDGFGAEAAEFAKWLTASYGSLLRALEYNFKNEDFATRVISENPKVVAERIKAELDGKDERHGAVIRCPDGGWSLALMKFTLDEAARSFPTHLRDLERRGMFNPAAKLDGRLRKEIEELFSAARTDAAARQLLGAKLREYGLFEDYEDRYLGLFK